MCKKKIHTCNSFGFKYLLAGTQRIKEDNESHAEKWQHLMHKQAQCPGTLQNTVCHSVPLSEIRGKSGHTSGSICSAREPPYVLETAGLRARAAI